MIINLRPVLDAEKNLCRKGRTHVRDRAGCRWYKKH